MSSKLNVNGQVPAGVVSLEEAKKNLVPGTRFFVSQTGSTGEILPELSARGKVQARMTCTEGGPDHVREVSDWHQCGKSPEKSKKKARKASKKGATVAAPSEGEALESELNTLEQSPEDALATKARLEQKVEQAKSAQA